MKNLNLTDLEFERLKVELIDSGFCDEVNRNQRIIASSESSSESFTAAYEFQCHWLTDDYHADLYHLAESLNHNRNQKTWRLVARVKNIVYNASEPVFLTFTFTDDCLSSTSEETRRKYVRRFLKLYGGQYVANIDFGAQNGREHYHAVASERVPVTSWTHGTINAERIRVSEKGKRDLCCQKIGRYICKLTNHAVKDSTCGAKLIYSRRPPFRTLESVIAEYFGS